eukprot:449334_1
MLKICVVSILLSCTIQEIVAFSPTGGLPFIGRIVRHPIHVWKGGSTSIFSSGNRPEWSHSFSLKISAHNSVKPDPPCQSERWWCPRVCLHLALHGMALAGLAETAFLTYHKIWGQGADICGEWGCGDILFGPFSQVAGVPLTIPAMLGYGILACLSIRGMRRTQEHDTNGIMILVMYNLCTMILPLLINSYITAESH